MKKLLILTAVFALTLAGCDDGGSNGTGNTADIVGTWTGSFGSGSGATQVTLDIAANYSDTGTWVLVFDYPPQSANGNWFRNGNNLTLTSLSSGFNSYTASLSGNTLILTISDMISGTSQTIRLTKGGSTNPSGNTSLKIKNDSFSGITDVRWSNVSFTRGDEAIRSGDSVTKPVQEGDGYIYFRRITAPINARTDERYTIEKNDQRVISINDNTIIVDVDNPGNKGTFGSLGVR